MNSNQKQPQQQQQKLIQGKCCNIVFNVNIAFFARLSSTIHTQTAINAYEILPYAFILEYSKIVLDTFPKWTREFESMRVCVC